MTMLKIRSGKFVRRGFPDQNVNLTRAFYLSDREVEIAQFQQFINDPQCPNEEKPAAWQDLWAGDEVGAHPQAFVNWYDAVLFCNWLSRKEGLLPCYDRTGK